MKNLRQLCVVVILTLVLTVGTSAGQIETTFTGPPPAPSIATEGQIETTITGQIQTGSNEAVDPVTEMAISLLQSVLPLF